MSEDTGEGYKLTDRGLWLAQGLEPKRWGTKRLEPPPVSSRRMQRIQDQEAPPSPPHPRPIESVTKGVVEDWIKALVLKRYSVEEARTIIRALHTLISSGILEISAQRFPYRRRDGERLHQPHGERRLEFSQFVLDNAFRYERQALLIGFNIVSLFYKTEELSLSSIAQDLCLRSQDEVGPHGIKVIYRQLLDLRQAQQ